MKTGIAEAVLVTMSLALAGCATSKVDKTGTNLYTLTYVHSLFSATGVMNNYFYTKAGNLCPKGYEKLSEYHYESWPSGPTYVWKIRCV